MRLIVLLIISLNVACAQLPDFPEVYQCVYLPSMNKFRCVNTRTKAKISLRLDDPRMNKALCVSVDDYRKSEAWVSQVKQIAERRCK